MSAKKSITLLIISIPMAFVGYTFVFLNLWNWFVIPMGAKFIPSFWHYMGLRLIVSSGSYEELENKTIKDIIIHNIAGWITYLLLGWIYYQFV